MKAGILTLCGAAVILFLNACATVSPPLWTAPTPQEEVRNAAQIMRDFRTMPDPGIPEAVLRHARGLAILQVARDGAEITGRAGKGIVVAHIGSGWSGPAFIATGGVGIGPQIGGDGTNLVLVLNTQEAVDAFARGGTVSFTGALSATAGPVGRNLEAGAVPVASVYSYSRTKGLFAGVSIGGIAFVPRPDTNDQYYNRSVTPRQILSGAVRPPGRGFAF